MSMQDHFSYEGWPNCIRLSNGQIEAIITTDVGPRVIRLGFIGGQNLFKEYSAELGKTGGEAWRIYGGHRLWHAPEAMPRTYAPDNTPVQYQWDGQTLKLTQPKESLTGIVKEMSLTMSPKANRVLVQHRLTNQNLWDVELSPWCLTVMAPGGRAIFPQEEFRSHSDYLLPARPLVLWHYTDMHDKRWKWGAKYIQLRQDPAQDAKQKIGLLNTRGWAAYALNGDLFIKRFACAPRAVYPDFGCNMETFVCAEMLELESLGPLTKLTPLASVEHAEQWSLDQEQIDESDLAIDEKVLPLLP